MQTVCFFNTIKFWGGGEKLHLEHAIEFHKKGYQVYIVTDPKSPLWEKTKQSTLKVFPLVVGNFSFLNPFKFFKLVQFYRSQNIDTVVFSASQDLKLGSMAAKWAGVTNIVYLRGLAVPVKASFLNRYIFKSVLTHIVSNSEETKRNILKYLGNYISHDKVHTIYHGIDFENLPTKQDDKLGFIVKNAKGIVLGNAGRLTAQKAQEKLIRVAKILKDQNIQFTLYIAGTGELHSELQTLIEELQLQEQVYLLGFVENMNAFMNSIDIFLLSSAWEGFGFVLVEAMLRAKPIVAFNISSNPEIVENDKTGFLVNYPNLEDFAEKTKQLILDTDLRIRMGQSAKQSVLDRFEIKERVTEFENYIFKLKDTVI